MSIELVIMDMDDPRTAQDILTHCANIMPQGFFSRLAICFPPVGFQFASNVEHIPCGFQNGNMYGFNMWLVREFPRFLVCDHCLTIHRDGYILNPDKWSDDFLNYDYLGAPWSAHRNGGNGGFCLFTKRFANFYSHHPFPLENGVPHDDYVCKVIEGTAKAAGFKYAPFEVNSRFSLEANIPERPRNLGSVFGFHGKWYLDMYPELRFR